VAEGGGFEPPVPVAQYRSLANCWFKPLTHLSVKPDSKTIFVFIQKNAFFQKGSANIKVASKHSQNDPHFLNKDEKIKLSAKDIFSNLTMLLIRNANEQDIPVIRQLAEEIWWPTYTPILEKDQIEYMLAHIYSETAMRNAMADKSQEFILLQSEDRFEGFASYSEYRPEKEYWKIHKLYVLREQQGKGFGKMLLEEIISRARKAGITCLMLNVNRSNPAFEFYKKMGFVLFREEDIPIGPYWMNDYVMRLKL
jgi:diamine N-acetyltransferase